MQSVMGLSTGAKEEVCSLQAKTEAQVGKPGREQSCTPCRTCSLCWQPDMVSAGMPALIETLN